MASEFAQKVKTTGWNATRGAWVKTASGTWKDVDQIYIKTTGWNNASGQESVQQQYYIANGQESKHKRCTRMLSYIANAQEQIYQVGTTKILTLQMHKKQILEMQDNLQSINTQHLLKNL